MQRSNIKFHSEIVNLSVTFCVKINIILQYKRRQTAVFLCLTSSSEKTQGKRKIKLKRKKKTRILYSEQAERVDESCQGCHKIICKAAPVYKHKPYVRSNVYFPQLLEIHTAILPVTFFTYNKCLTPTRARHLFKITSTLNMLQACLNHHRTEGDGGASI